VLQVSDNTNSGEDAELTPEGSRTETAAARVIAQRVGPLVTGAAAQLSCLRCGGSGGVGDVAVSLAEYRWASAVIGTRSVHAPPLSTGAGESFAQVNGMHSQIYPRVPLHLCSNLSSKFNVYACPLHSHH